MVRHVLCAVLLATHFLGGWSNSATAEEKSWQKAELKQLRGQWTTSRAWKDEGKARRYQLTLDFTDDKLEFFTEEGGKKGLPFTLDVIGVEKVEGGYRLVLGREGKKGSVVYYAFEKEKLILVGTCPPYRPFEGFPLSGEYKRAE